MLTQNPESAKSPKPHKYRRGRGPPLTPPQSDLLLQSVVGPPQCSKTPSAVVCHDISFSSILNLLVIALRSSVSSVNKSEG